MKSEVILLPGPVKISKKVKLAFSQPPLYHRSKEFISLFEEVRMELCKFTKAKNVQLMMGSGTLANDALAAQLSRLNEKGLILTNGEFGERLVDHGHRHKLEFDILKYNWGESYSLEEVTNTLASNPTIKWLWCVHCESSTGVIVDLDKLRRICSDTSTKLCLDCMSTIGSIPVNLQETYLATGCSGKGLGSFSGISFVFHNHEILPAPNILPRYLDLGIYASSIGSPFTFSSNLLLALHTAINSQKWEDHFKRIIRLSKWVRLNLINLGFPLVASNSNTSPAIITICLPSSTNCLNLGDQLAEKGYLLSYRSYYLIKRNWIQIVLMVDHPPKTIEPLFKELKTLVNLDFNYKVD